MNIDMTYEEQMKKQEAYWDANTLLQAELIKADEARLTAARPALEDIKAEQEKKLKALKKIKSK